MRNPKLKPWLDEGIRRVSINGHADLKISEIAINIGISKSSFYHFFNTKEEYLEQLIEYWEEEEETVNIIKHVLLQKNLKEPITFLLNHTFSVNFENELVLQQFRASAATSEYQKKRYMRSIRLEFLF